MLAQWIQVAVLPHPGDSMGGGSRHRSLEEIDRLVVQSQEGIGACDIVEGLVVVGLNCERALGPGQGSLALAQERQRASAVKGRGGPIRFPGQFPLASRQGLARGCFGLQPHAECRVQGHKGKEKTDIVRSQVGGSAEQPHGFLLSAQQCTSAAIKEVRHGVVGLVGNGMLE